MTRILLVDDDGAPYDEVPKGNDRMFAVELHNRMRVQKGTATLHRLLALYQRIKARYPRCTMTPPRVEPIVWRAWRGGPKVLVVDALPGPVASVASKQ